MNKGFWDKLKKPIIVLAPMADVTDAAFRRIIVKHGKPDVIWTEFVSCDGLCSEQGRKNLSINLKYTKAEKPIVAQIFGSDPKNFYKCAQYIKKLGFDGIDINMGCPEKSICKQGSGAALINTPEIAKEIIREAKKGAGKLPVSVKIRTGYGKEDLENWVSHLVEAEPTVIIIHGRTKKEMSEVPVNWKLIGKVANKLKQKFPDNKRPLVIGNGDVVDLDDAYAKAEKYEVDGVMIGRGVLGNPWFFNPNKKATLEEKLSVLVEHTLLYEKILGNKKPFDIMKKHFKSYVSGFKGAKDLRIKLMACKDAKAVRQIIDNYTKDNPEASNLT